ncbi:MAG: hypothetical protein AABY42_11035, partial [Nitrospirota bacterium]
MKAKGAAGRAPPRRPSPSLFPRRFRLSAKPPFPPPLNHLVKNNPSPRDLPSASATGSRSA